MGRCRAEPDGGAGSNLISRIFRSLPELIESLAERDDRIHVRLGVDSEVDQERALRPLRRIEGRRYVLELLDSQRRQPVRLAELHEVRHVRQVDLRSDASVEVVLELAHHAEREVVEQDDLHVELVLDGDRKLLRGHHESALAGHAPHRQVRPGELGAKRRREGEAHCARATRVDAETRSSTRMPTIIKTSAFWTAFRHQPVPMNPVMWSERGCLTGNAPIPSSVVPTGAAAASASCMSSRSAWLSSTP